jgi:hypothetical protein
MRVVVVLLPLTVVAGCTFSVDFSDGKIQCSTTDRSCPPSYYCHADNRCWKMPESSDGAASANDDLASNGGTARDMAAAQSHDMARPMSTPDMIASGCTGSGRVCDGTNSAVCSGGMTVLDRTCPAGSDCSVGGVCRKPATLVPCSDSRTCGKGNVCAPFVDGGVIKFYCAPALASATVAIGGTCKAPGVDTSCPSGYCVLDTNNPANLCLFVCDPNANNPCGNGNLNCDPAQGITIEGVPAMSLHVCSN